MRAGVALLTQHAMRVRHIVTSFVASLAPSHSSTLCHKRQNFREKGSERKMCFYFLYKFRLKHSHSKYDLARYYHKCENVVMSSTFYSCRTLMKLEICRPIFEES